MRSAWWTIALTLAAGCGRLEFDGHAGDAGWSPSNGVAFPTAALGDLTIDASVVLSTDDGAISSLRGAGLGVIAGVEFARVAQDGGELAVFGVHRLVIARGIEGGFEVQVETELDDVVLAMEPMDLDQDGLVDVVVRHTSAQDELSLMRLTESLSFEPAMRLRLTHAPQELWSNAELAVADLNADGHADFITLVSDPELGWRAAVVVSRPEQPT